MPLFLFLAWLQQSTSSGPTTPAPILNRDLFGVSIDRAGDLDGDGIEDLWIADPSDAEGAGPEPFQCLWAVSGATGQAIRRIAPPREDVDFAASICSVGDVDGDGIIDVASASDFAPTPEVPRWSTAIGHTSPQGESAVFLLSGASGDLLRIVSGPADCPKIGYLHVDGPSLSAAGDWNRDGSCDLAIGWAFDDSGALDGGRVAIVSGADGSILQAWNGTGQHDCLGSALCTLADLDGDGRPELAACALPAWEREAGPEYPLLAKERAGYVQILSSKGGVRQTFRPKDAERSFGLSLARFPDVDGDEVEELLIGRPFGGGGNIHLVSLKRGDLLRVFEDPYYVSWSTGGKQSAPPPRKKPVDPDDWRAERLQERVGYEFGTRLASIADRDGDGRADVLVTVATGGGPFDPYYAGVLSSKTGRPIAIVPHLDGVRVGGQSECTTYLGTALCTLPDMDGDSVEDFAIGGGSPKGLVCPGAVVVISGKELVPFRWIVGVELRR